MGRQQQRDAGIGRQVVERALERLVPLAPQRGGLRRVRHRAVMVGLAVAVHIGVGRRMSPGTADRQVGSNPEEPGPNLFGRSAGTRLGRQTQERFLEEIFSGAGIAGRTDEEGINLRVMGLVHRDHETVRPARKLTNRRSVELIQRRRTFHVTYNARCATLF